MRGRKYLRIVVCCMIYLSTEAMRSRCCGTCEVCTLGQRGSPCVCYL